MDFILEEEMIDIITLCLQEPNSELIPEKKERFKEIGKEYDNNSNVRCIISTKVGFF